jgi:carbon storage regulator
MLILARRVNETIMIGDQIEVSVVDIRGEQVKLGIKAPPAVKVYRQEVYAAIQQENVAAASSEPRTLPPLEPFIRGKGGAAGKKGGEPPRKPPEP